MNKYSAAPVASMAQRMFLLAGAIGTVLGLLSLLAIFWPAVRAAASGGIAWESLEAGIWSIIGIAAFFGLAVGLLCCAAMYVAVEILATRDADASPRKQSLVAGLGASIGGLLPGLIILAMGAANGEVAPYALTALGFLLVCALVGSMLVAGLNCQQARALRA